MNLVARLARPVLDDYFLALPGHYQALAAAPAQLLYHIYWQRNRIRSGAIGGKVSYLLLADFSCAHNYILLVIAPAYHKLGFKSALTPIYIVTTKIMPN